MDRKGLFVVFMAVISTRAFAKQSPDPASDQLVTFKETHTRPVGVITTGAGEPVEYNEATNTLNEDLLTNEFFVESLLHLSRERIPERIIHAKGTGAFGFFQVTHNISDICKASLFSEVGKKTPVAVRFSIGTVERGGIDTTRESRGFAVKFYTEQGNWDIVGLNFPMFQLKDPLFFHSFLHSVKRNPVTNLLDFNMFWDVFTLHPESFYLLLVMFGDKGIPDGYRYMPGFSIHTYQVVNDAGESFFVRFKFSPDAGIKNVFSEKAMSLAAEEPDYAVKDLYNAIAEGNFPSWTCYVQVLTKEDVQNAGFDVFDISRVLPEDKYPPRPFGRIVLNRNAVNFFGEIEQLAFCPSNLVPGILGAPDKAFEARRLSYKDAQRYRLGANFFNIPVNCPINTKAYTYNRDGVPPVNDNQRDMPNYYSNSFNGPKPYHEKNRTKLIEIYQRPPYNLDQARDLYNSYSSDEKKRFVKNVVPFLKLTTSFLQQRAIKIFSSINKQLGKNIELAVQANSTQSD